jgi:cobalt-precorrin-5B (C1)-methyltransferase
VSLRSGITTGTCAAAAAQAATAVLLGQAAPAQLEVRLPQGAAVRVPILYARLDAGGGAATAAVQKDAGDDPDVTHGLEIRATVSWSDAAEVTLAAGEGVGRVTRPGLQVPPGEPAINPVPRRMIVAAVRELTPRGVRVQIAIPGGRQIAAHTFNPRLGIEGGLSILGTTGIVRPFCRSALYDALKCTLDVAAACGVAAPVLVPGNIGARAAGVHFSLRDGQLIEVGNEWGFLLGLLGSYGWDAVMILGHPGKLAKLAQRQWDTHSARSGAAVEFVGRLCREVLARPAPESPTSEGIFLALPEAERKVLADELARRVAAAVSERLGGRFPVAVFLVAMDGKCLGSEGDFWRWR